jgi:hypothetical protein
MTGSKLNPPSKIKAVGKCSPSAATQGTIEMPLMMLILGRKGFKNEFGVITDG